MSQRDKFEKWAAESSMKLDLDRGQNDKFKFAWSGLYKSYYTQAAWAAWQEASKHAPESD